MAKKKKPARPAKKAAPKKAAKTAAPKKKPAPSKAAPAPAAAAAGPAKVLKPLTMKQRLALIRIDPTTGKCPHGLLPETCSFCMNI